MSEGQEQPKQVTPESDVKDQKDEHVFVEPEIPQKKIELQEEAKLRSKYPAGLNRPGSSAFLQKRLSKGQKYFDSGDYNMAKAKGQKKIGLQDKVPGSTGDTIPTPEDLHSRKTSLTASKLAAGSLRPLGGGAIPTPESLPTRKPVYMQSKLAVDMS